MEQGIRVEVRHRRRLGRVLQEAKLLMSGQDHQGVLYIVPWKSDNSSDGKSSVISTQEETVAI